MVTDLQGTPIDARLLLFNRVIGEDGNGAEWVREIKSYAEAEDHLYQRVTQFYKHEIPEYDIEVVELYPDGTAFRWHTEFIQQPLEAASYPVVSDYHNLSMFRRTLGWFGVGGGTMVKSILIDQCEVSQARSKFGGAYPAQYYRTYKKGDNRFLMLFPADKSSTV